MTISAILSCAAIILFGNEHAPPAAEVHAPVATSTAHESAAPSKHPQKAEHGETAPSGEVHPPAQAGHEPPAAHKETSSTESDHGDTTTHELPSVQATASHPAAHDKKRHSIHAAPKVPERPKGVLCGALPPKKITWKSKQGPLTLVGTVVIGPGTELIIGAGTEVKVGGFDSCPDSGSTATNGRSIALVVRGGKLRLEGSARKPIRFVVATAGSGYLWNGIRVERASRDDDARLRWIELSRATKGVSFLAGAGSLEHAVVEDCGIGVASLLGASPTISHSVIARSGIAAIASNRSATRIVSSLVMDGGDGIRFDGVGLSSISTSCFWGQSGTEIVRGPVGVGSWKGDSVPDRFGNWNRDPVLRGSATHERKLAEARKAMEAQPWWKPRRPPEDPVGSGRWSLSPYSPLIDKGETRFCSDMDGTKCDIGLWGGR